MKRSSSPIDESLLEEQHRGPARRRRLGLTVALVGAWLLPAVAAPSRALATPPDFSTEVIDAVVPSPFFSATCGFPTWYVIHGTVKVSVRNGNITMIRYGALSRTLNGPGGSLTQRETGLDQITTEVTADGYVDTIHSAGHFNHSWIVPGYGPVQLNAGSAQYQLTYVWDASLQDFVITEQVFHEGGPTDMELTAADVAALCGYLG